MWRHLALIPLVSAARFALADTALEEEQCPASTIEQARALADQLRQEGMYQLAGECYEAAGEFALANQAFLDAVGAESKATANQLSDQRSQAQMLLRQLQRAFHSGH